ncbi:MAG: tetratricopeptide repeat protein [Gaiellaceae bacterium]
MSARARVLAVVAAAAAVAVGAVVAGTLLQTRGEHTGTVARTGTPPLELELGLNTGPQATALARAATLYAQGKRAEAETIFARYHSLEAEIGAAFAAWPHGGLDALKRLVAANPKSALAELHLGWAYYWSGRGGDATTAWQRATTVDPDSPAAVDAQDILHPATLPGLPFIIVPSSPPASITALPARQELAALARAARRPDARSKLYYGLALWNLRRPVSAERAFRAAAALAPNDPVVRTAAAVGAYSKSDPVAAFSRLGPLTGTFPRAAVVRFHLGLVLLWQKEVAKAKAQLRLAAAEAPGSVWAKQAKALLKPLAGAGTK